MASEEMSESVLRQRRNLMAISVLLLLFDFAGVDILKVGFAGTEFVVAKPEVFVVFAWVVWGYLLLRYYQYLRTTDIGVRGAYNNSVNHFMVQDGFRRNVFASQRQAQVEAFRRGLLRWQIEEKKTNRDTGSVDLVKTHTVPQVVAIRSHIRSAWMVTFRTTKITDYILPYVLAFSVPVVSVISSAAR